MNWPREIAEEILRERPNEEVYTIASGVSPSGFIHIGNFREIITPYLIAKALKKMGKNVRFILSIDEYDRLRKVPGNIPSEWSKYIGMPYVDVPSPFSENETYAEYMENRFLGELKAMGIEVECIYQAQKYRNGDYKEYIKKAMDNRHKIFEIIDSFRTQDATQEEIDNFYPISIYCPICHKDSTHILNYNDESGEFLYECDCGHTETQNIMEARNIKLQWKVDWPMRWKYEGVVFESGGADHSADNGSQAVAKRVAREIFDYEPPVYHGYNFIGIKGGGAKMSSSTGNVLTLTDLLRIYDRHIITWFYAKYRPMQCFDLALDNDVIRYYQEFDRMVKAYFDGKLDEKNKEIIESTEVTEDYLLNPNFSYMANFLPMVNYNVDALKDILRKEGIECEGTHFENRLEAAKNWVTTYGKDYEIKLVDEKNTEYYETLSDMEKEWVKKTINLLGHEYANSDELQTVLYAVIKDYCEEDKWKENQKR